MKRARWSSTAIASRSASSTPGTLPSGQTARTCGLTTSTAFAPTPQAHLPPYRPLRTPRRQHQPSRDSQPIVITDIPQSPGTLVPRSSKPVPSQTLCSSNSIPPSKATAQVFGRRTPPASARRTRTQLLTRHQPHRPRRLLLRPRRRDPRSRARRMRP